MVRYSGIVALLSMLFFSALSPAAEPPRLSVAPGLKIAVVKKPTHIANANDDSGRIFITEQEGRILIVQDGTLQADPFLDIRDRVGCCGERGLLSVVFPPGFREKRHFYVDYTDRNGDTVVARFQLSAKAERADRASEEVVLTVKQPYANHNGGQLAFGPDGYLYIGMGDGGSGGDPQGNGQRLDTLLGKLLRIDVESGARTYAVPHTNPFLGRSGARPEIWAYGLRNPWRFSFDRKNGELAIADVGQNDYEEVNIIPASSKGGENYGWNTMEGLHCFRRRTCDSAGLVLPVAEYDHRQGCSVTGGMVYRGTAYPGLAGTYFYGDFCSGRIWGLRKQGERWNAVKVADTGLSISTFGEDEAGELYVADYRSGGIFRLEAQ
jgi:glucose/arabinose dehydrogenase